MDGMSRADLPSRREARAARSSPAERSPGPARAGRAVLLTLAAIAIAGQSALIAAAGWAAANPRVVVDTVTVWQYEPTPAIAGYAARAAMSEHGRFVFYASRPQVLTGDAFDRVCSRSEPGIGVLGCYTLADGRIHLYDITNVDLDEFEVVVAAHEMLHAAWDRLSPEEQQALKAPLEEAYAQVEPGSDLAERIAAYEAADPGSRIRELYAIVGTELATVPPELEEHYARWFDNRSQVVTLWQDVQEIFLQLEAELERLSTELERLAAEIEAEQAAAERIARQLEADIEAFNARASRPGGYTSQSAFERDRQSLIDRQAALTRTIEATNAKVDAYNALVEQFTALNEEAAALDRDLNIDPQPLPPGEEPAAP